MAEQPQSDDALLMGATSYAPMVDFQLPQAPEPPKPVEESDQGFWNQFQGSIGSTIFQDNPRLSGRAIEGLGRVSGSDSIKEFGQSIVADFDAAPEHEKFIPRVSTYKDVEGFESLMDYMGSGLGQGLGSIAMTVGGAAAGAGIAAVGGGAVGAAAGGVGAIPAGAAAAVGGGAIGGGIAGSFLLNYGDMYGYLVEQEGLDEETAAHWALIPGTAMAALDAYGVGKLAAPLKLKLSQDLATRTAQLALQGGGIEGITEASQQIIQETAGELAEALGYATEDIEFSQRWENIVNGGIIGFLTGGTVGGASAPVVKPEEAPPAGAPPPVDVEEDIADAPQTAEEADPLTGVMAEEAAEPEAEAAPEVEAEPETEAEQAAEAEVQKEEDPQEPKSDLTLTSDGKSFSKVFKFLLNPPPGVGYEKTILDEQGNPVQEQEVDENGEPVFLESGKPKMGPARTQRVYKVSDLYAEDEKGKASGALSKYPKGELELLGVHEFLISKSIGDPNAKMEAERRRAWLPAHNALADAVQALASGAHEVNPEFTPTVLGDPTSISSYLADPNFTRGIDGEAQQRIADEAIEQLEAWGEPEALGLVNKYDTALEAYNKALERAYDRNVGMWPHQFISRDAEAEVTQDEINQYIADNQWRLDFGDTRRQTGQAYGDFVASPELQQFEAAVISLQSQVTGLELDARTGTIGETAGAPTIEEVVDVVMGDDPGNKSVWGEIGSLNQQNTYHDPALLDQVISNPSAFHRHMNTAIADEVTEVQSLAAAPESLWGRPMDQAVNAFGKVIEFFESLDAPLFDESVVHFTEVLEQATSLRETIKSDLAALGGKDRQIQLIQEINDWVSSKTPEEYIGQDAPLRRQLPRVYASTKFQNLIDELSTKKWELADPAFIAELLTEWAKVESIYSEQMPARQQRLFIKEFEAQKKKYIEAYLINTHVVVEEGALFNIIIYISDLKKFEEAENTDLVRTLRAKQKELSEKSAEQKSLRDSEMAEFRTSGGLGYTISSEPPQLSSLNLTAKKPVNMRQILIIDPSEEMRDYKDNLRDAPPGIDLKKGSYTDQERAGIPDSWWNKWRSIEDYKSAGNELIRKLYQATHWGYSSRSADPVIEERGTGVHIRVHDMWIKRAGELIKILVIDEVQNDHAQDNRKFGSRISALRSMLLKSRLEANEARRQEIIDLSNSAENPNAVSGSLVLIPERTFWHRTTLMGHGNTKINNQTVDPALKDEYVALVKEAGKLNGQIKIGDPQTGGGRQHGSAVFKNTEEWSQLAMRKAFQIAIEEDYGGIAVIGGLSANPITRMPAVEANLTKLRRQFADLDGEEFFALKGLLIKEQDQIWNETKWSGKIGDMPLNIEKLNQTIGLNDFIQTGRLRSEQVPGFEGQGRPRPVFDDRNFPIKAFYQDPKTGKFEKVVTVPSEDPAGQTSLIFNVTTESGETKSVSAENLSYQGDYVGVSRKPGTMPFLIPEDDRSAGLYGKTIKAFLESRDEYIGSSAQKHYDENVADQGKIIAGVEGTPAMGEDILRIADGTPVYTIDEANPDFSTSLLKDHLAITGRDAYIKAPPKLWVFDDKMTKRLSGPQPIISPELRDIKGGWDRSLKDLLNDEREKAKAKRKEGVTYFEDMTHHEHFSIVKRIKDSIQGLPNLEYPFTASLGKAGGKAVEILGHVKGVTVTVKMSETKTATMPATNIFVGNDRLVEKDVQYLLDPKVAERIRKDHLESIRKAMEEGHDIPQESLADHEQADGGGWGLEEDYELEEDVEADVEPEPLWYSVLERSVASLPDEPIPVDDVEGTLQRAARRLVGEDVDLAVVPKQRREGVVYIDDLTEPQLDEIAKQIEKQKENLPNLEYPFSATIGSPGGDKTKNIEVVRHVGKGRLEVKLENGRTIEVPPDSVYVGSAPLVAKKPERLVDPDFKRKGSAGAEISTSEIAALKLDDFIEDAKASGQKSISKEDLAKHVEENQIQIGEVIFGDPEMERSPEVAEAKANFEDAWTAALPTILSIGNRHIDGGFTTAQIHRMKHRPDEMVYATVVHDLSEALNAATRAYSNFRILSAAEASASPLAHLTEAAEPLASIDRSEFYSVSNNFTRTYNPEAIVEAIEKVRTAYRFLYLYNRPDVVQTRKEDVKLMVGSEEGYSGRNAGTGIVPSVTEHFSRRVKYLRDRDRWSDSLPDQKQAQEIIERNTAYESIEKFLGIVGRKNPDAPAYADPDSRLFDGGNLIKDLISDPRWVDYMDKHGKLKAVEGDSARREAEFEQWTLPGGENYYEIVLTAETGLKARFMEYNSKILKIYDRHERGVNHPAFRRWNEYSREELQLMDDITPVERELLDLQEEYQNVSHIDRGGRIDMKQRSEEEIDKILEAQYSLLGEPYTEGHHGVDNTVAHIRLKVRIDSEGRRILFVEEIQSDWHQQGRKRGYSKEENKALISGWQKQLDEIAKLSGKLSKQEVAIVMEERQQAFETFRETGEMPSSGSKNLSDEVIQIRKQQQKLRDKRIKIEEKIEYAAEMGPVVEGEFKKTQEWAGLAVRRVLREAAEGGYDGVAFTTGDSVYGIMRGDLEGQRKFYDEILPSIVKKESKNKLSTTTIKIPTTGDFGNLTEHEQEDLILGGGAQEVYEDKVFNFVEMTPEVKARGMKAQKLFEVLIAASSVPAAAALMGEDEEEPKKAEQ